MYSDHARQAPPGRIERSNGMLTRNKKLKDYGIPEEDIEVGNIFDNKELLQEEH